MSRLIRLVISLTLSASLSRDVGQKASAPSLFDSLFTGAPTFWNHVLAFAVHLECLSALVLLVAMLCCQETRMELIKRMSTFHKAEYVLYLNV